MLIIGAAALIIFGPDQLPKVARRAGEVMRDIQNTSHSFVREMERAADASETHWEPPPNVGEPSAAPPTEPSAAPAPGNTVGERGKTAFAHDDFSV